MSKQIKRIIKFLSIASVFTPLTALAATAVQQGLSIPGFSNLFGGTGLSAEKSLPALILDVIQILLLVAGGIAVLFIIIGGYWYITSAGNAEQAEKGRGALVNAIIGIVLIVMSYAIITVVQNTVSGY